MRPLILAIALSLAGCATTPDHARDTVRDALAAYNARHDTALPTPRVEYVHYLQPGRDSATRRGEAHAPRDGTTRPLIRIRARYADHCPHDLERLLLHELAHVITAYRAPEWIREHTGFWADTMRELLPGWHSDLHRKTGCY